MANTCAVRLHFGQNATLMIASFIICQLQSLNLWTSMPLRIHSREWFGICTTGTCIQICSRCTLCPNSKHPTIICNHTLMGWALHSTSSRNTLGIQIEIHLVSRIAWSSGLKVWVLYLAGVALRGGTKAGRYRGLPGLNNHWGVAATMALGRLISAVITCLMRSI